MNSPAVYYQQLSAIQYKAAGDFRDSGMGAVAGRFQRDAARNAQYARYHLAIELDWSVIM